jgi:hypothetical protein
MQIRMKCHANFYGIITDRQHMIHNHVTRSFGEIISKSCERTHVHGFCMQLRLLHHNYFAVEKAHEHFAQPKNPRLCVTACDMKGILTDRNSYPGNTWL